MYSLSRAKIVRILIFLARYSLSLMRVRKIEHGVAQIIYDCSSNKMMQMYGVRMYVRTDLLDL